MDAFSNITFISLGYNCAVKLYIDTFASQPTYLFDWIGSSMWGINKLINNSFDLCNKEDFKTLQIYIENKEYTYLCCNTVYYFRFIHDLPTYFILDRTHIQKNKHGDSIKLNYFDTFKSKYTRRIERFQELLQSNTSVVFVRLEECMENKVIHENYIKLYSISELDHIKEFMKLIKQKYPLLKFKVIYISKSHQTELKNNLLILHNNNNNNDIKEIFTINIHLINMLII
jgi:hypothetical protein